MDSMSYYSVERFMVFTGWGLGDSLQVLGRLPCYKTQEARERGSQSSEEHARILLSSELLRRLEVVFVPLRIGQTKCYSSGFLRFSVKIGLLLQNICTSHVQSWGSPKAPHLKPGPLKMPSRRRFPCLDGAFSVELPQKEQWELTCRVTVRISVLSPRVECGFQCEIPFSDVPL